jgi:glucose/arabinose dehydrogenase
MAINRKRAMSSRSFFRRAGLLLVVLISGAGPAIVLTPLAQGGTPLDLNFTETVFFSDSTLNFPTRIAWAPDGSNRLFVLHKNGDVRIVQNGVLLPIPFANIYPLHTALECGLTGIAFDPNYVSNRYLYLFATVSSNEQQIIRYTEPTTLE